MQPIDPTVLAELYRQHAPALRLYARQWGVSVEDIVQDTFVRLAQQPRLPEHIAAWLYRVVRNEVMAVQRSAFRRKRREQRASPLEAWFCDMDVLEVDEATRLLAELTLELREVIVARLWGSLTFEEIARLVGCSLPTAHRRYQTGLAQLRERLEPHANAT